MARDFVFRIKPGDALPPIDPTGYRLLLSGRELQILDSNGVLSNLIQNSQGGDYLPKSGGLMSGDIQMASGTKIASENGDTNFSLLNSYFQLQTSGSFKGGDYNHSLISDTGILRLSARNTLNNNIGMIGATSESAFMSYQSGGGFENSFLSVYQDIGITSMGDIQINPTNVFYINNLPIYADNASALSGGLTTNAVYKTVTGELRIVV